MRKIEMAHARNATHRLNDEERDNIIIMQADFLESCSHRGFVLDIS
jgi:hypothetical protein